MWPDQCRKILQPLTQWWNRHANHIQAVAKIAAKPSVLNLARQRTIGRGDDSRIHAPDDATRPSRRISPSCSTRSSLACTRALSSATSSRKSVPPCASSNRPIRSAIAPVNAPRVWPKSSASTRSSAKAAQFNAQNRLVRRAAGHVHGACGQLFARPALAFDQVPETAMWRRVGRPGARPVCRRSRQSIQAPRCASTRTTRDRSTAPCTAGAAAVAAIPINVAMSLGRSGWLVASTGTTRRRRWSNHSEPATPTPRLSPVRNRRRNARVERARRRLRALRTPTSRAGMTDNAKSLLIADDEGDDCGGQALAHQRRDACRARVTRPRSPDRREESRERTSVMSGCPRAADSSSTGSSPKRLCFVVRVSARAPRALRACRC